MAASRFKTLNVDQRANRSMQIGLLVLTLASAGCPTKYREDLDYGYNVEQTLSLDGTEATSIVQFE